MASSAEGMENNAPEKPARILRPATAFEILNGGPRPKERNQDEPQKSEAAENSQPQKKTRAGYLIDRRAYEGTIGLGGAVA